MQIIFRRHALLRMLRRGIDSVEVEEAVMHGEVIEDYPLDTPYPSCLKLAVSTDGPLHVVVAEDSTDAIYFVITVYRPDPARWSSDWRRRSRP